MAKQDYKYEGVGYNGPHLAALPYDKFKAEVEHHFQTGDNREERIKDLFDKVTKKYPQPVKAKFVAPVEEEAAKPLTERAPAEEVKASATTNEPPQGEKK